MESIFNLICEASFPKNSDDAYQVLNSRAHLERIKDSTVRNVVIVLLKRLFVDEESIPQDTTEAIAAALEAIERMNPEVTKGVFSEKFVSMGQAEMTRG